MKSLTRPLAIIGILALMIGVSAWQIQNPAGNATITGGTCTNQVTTAINTSGVPTCTTLTSAYVDSSIAPTASPSLTTPTLGVATATSINRLAITAPATSATLAVANGKTFTASNSLTLAGTDATTMTFPPTSASVATNLYTETSTSGATTTTVSGVDTAMFTGYSMPGGTLTANHRLHIRACWKHTTGTTSTTYKISIGGVVATAMPAGTGVPAVCADFDFAAADGTHQQLLEYATAGLASTLSNAQQNAYTATLSGTVAINFVANAASNTDVNTAYLLTVDLY